MDNRTLQLYIDWKHTQAQVVEHTKRLLLNLNDRLQIEIVTACILAEATAHDAWLTSFEAERTPEQKGN